MVVRILLGILLLLCLAALAGLIQARWADGVRTERDALMRARGARTAAGDGWSRVVVGRPSGAAPADVEWPQWPEPPVTDDGEWFEDGGLGDTGYGDVGYGDTGYGDTGYGDDPTPYDDVVPPRPEPEPPAQTWHITVRPGMVLSKICAEVYGRGTPDIVAAVARYNGIDDPDQIRPGDELVLPPFDEL